MSDRGNPNQLPPDMSPTDMLIAEGLHHHQSGQLNRAEDCYRDALKQDPANADAYHLLGLIAHKTGHHSNAVELIEKAISIKSDNSVFHANLAIVLNVMGREKDAEAVCRTGLTLDPQNVDILNSLAHALARQGEFTGAEAAYRDAVDIQPDNASLRSNLATLLMESARLQEAQEHLEHAIAIDPSFAAAHANISIIHRTFGRLDEAEAACRRGIMIDPSYTLGHLNLGTVLLERRDFAGAEKAYRVVLSLAPEHPEALGNLATIAGLRGDTEGALKIYRHLLNLDPQLPEFHNAIAVVQLNAGRIREAVAGFKRAISIAPHYFDAYYNLVYAPDSGLDEEAATFLEPFIDAPSSSTDDKIRLNFTVGEIRRRAGDYDKAWQNFVAGNEWRQKLLQGRGLSFDADFQSKLTQSYFETFNAAYFDAEREAASSTEVPVFVVGVPRSGTSLVEQILATHPEVYGAGELPDLGMMIERVKSLGPGANYPVGIGGIEPSELRQTVSPYIARLRELGGSALRVVDKSHFNYRHLGLISSIWPNARIIYCRRDELDIGLSCFLHNFTDSLAWSTDLENIGCYIRNYQAFMAHWQKVLPTPPCVVDYEELVRTPEPVIRRLLEHINVPWDENCLAPHEAKRVVQTASKWQVREPISDRSVGQSAAYGDRLTPLKDALDKYA